MQTALQQLQVKHSGCAANITVHSMESSNPCVFQARAAKDFAVGEVVLIPHGPVHDFSEGAKMRRPKSHHPQHPYLVTTEIGAYDICDDLSKYIIQSPLAQFKPGKALGVSPFWAVLEATAADTTVGNLEARCLTQEISCEFKQDGRKQRGKDKTPTVTILVPALVNVKAVMRGAVFVAKPAAIQNM
ncbi:unnamed protein product [Prorocentrum cordatum]|uniref:Uncharacterized protein n=1 Tax=Prorocentrum cordatum TaxID=2364126 RepID=A0ABN9TJZ8_9DINO|nr:unnamed protein product [Polarella glacialis]